MSSGTRLRELLREGPVVAPGAYDAIVARVIEEAGFPAVYLSGSGISCARGKPDVGWLSLSEVAAAVAGVVDAVGVPVIADADTGYGAALTVRRTVREFERAGVAALHLEDQSTPKRCAYFAGAELVSATEMVGKLRAAVDARDDADLVIIARTDALQFGGLEEAIARGTAYLEVGADALFVNAIHDRETMLRIRDAFPDALLVYNLNAVGVQAVENAGEAAALGYRLTILPGLARLAVLQTVRELMQTIRTTGTFAGFSDRMETFREFNEFMGLRELQELEARYQRDAGAVVSRTPVS